MNSARTPSLTLRATTQCCGTYGVGSGAVNTYTNATAGINVTILAANADGSYRVRLVKGP